MAKRTQPMQSVERDAHGVARFRVNELVRFLLDEATEGRKCDMNRLAVQDFPQEDREQFAQLIGYSIGGYSELSYVSDRSYEAAERKAIKALDGAGKGCGENG
jgi:hypothetical protein